MYTPFSKATLYVNKSLVEEYKNNPYWGLFKNIVGMETSNVNSIEKEVNVNKIYDLQGNSHDRLKKGIFIIKDKYGKSQKVLIK